MASLTSDAASIIAKDAVSNHVSKPSALIATIEAEKRREHRNVQQRVQCHSCLCRRSRWSVPAGVEAAAAVRAGADRMARLMLLVKDAHADALNDFSLEAFFERAVSFVVGLVILLRGTQPWYVALGSAETIARALAAHVWVYRAILKRAKVRDALLAGTPGPRYLDAAVLQASVVGSVAVLPAGLVSVVTLLPAGGYPGATAIVLACLLAAGLAEVACTIVLAVRAAVAVGQAYSRSVSSSWASAAGLHRMAAGAGTVICRVMLCRGFAWMCALLAGLVLGLLRYTGSSPSAGSSWLLAMRVAMWTIPAVLLGMGALALVGGTLRLWEYSTASRQEHRLRQSEALHAVSSGGAVRPAAIQRQDATRMKAMARSTAFLMVQFLAAGVLAGLWILLLVQVDAVLRPFGLSSIKDASTALGLVAAVDGTIDVGGALGTSNSTAILATWISVQVGAMACLVMLARSLQATWDADDEANEARVTLTASQQSAAQRARDTLGGRAGAPLTLEKVSDGVYRRRHEDSRACALGVQIVTNPLHDLKNVVDAMHRRARTGTTTTGRFRAATDPAGTGTGPGNTTGAGAHGQAQTAPRPGGLRIRTVSDPTLPQYPHEGGTTRRAGQDEGDSPQLAAPPSHRTLVPPQPLHAGTLDLSDTASSALPSLLGATLAIRLQDVVVDDGHGSPQHSRHSTTGTVVMELSPQATAPPPALPAMTLSIPSHDTSLYLDTAGRTAGPAPGAAMSPLHRLAVAVSSPMAGMRAVANVGFLAAKGGITVQRSATSAGMGRGSPHAHAASTSVAGGRTADTPHAPGSRPPCFICFDQPADCVFMDCGHAGACMQCATSAVRGAPEHSAQSRRSGGSGLCPICRAPVMTILHIGPDTVAVDGTVVALVLPHEYWAGQG